LDQAWLHPAAGEHIQRVGVQVASEVFSLGFIAGIGLGEKMIVKAHLGF
jgi:hypothetical protein